MKKFTLALGLGAILIAGTCVANPVEQINTNIANALTPIQNENTIAQITFKDLKTNTTRLEHASLHALFSKIGPKNTFKINLNDLSYNDGDEETFVSMDGSLDFDFSKVFPKRERERLVSTISDTFFDHSKSMVGYRNSDASIKRHISSYTKDEKGHYTSINAIIIARSNLDKLSDEEKNYIPASEIIISYSINLKTGLKINAFMGINKDSRAYDSLGANLLAFVDIFVDGDERALRELRNAVSGIDAFASELVEFGTMKKYLPFLQKTAA